MSMDMHWVRHVSYRFRYEFCVAFSTSSGYLDCEDLRVVSVVDRRCRLLAGGANHFWNFLMIIYLLFIFRYYLSKTSPLLRRWFNHFRTFLNCPYRFCDNRLCLFNLPIPFLAHRLQLISIKKYKLLAENVSLLEYHLANDVKQFN